MSHLSLVWIKKEKENFPVPEGSQVYFTANSCWLWENSAYNIRVKFLGPGPPAEAPWEDTLILQPIPPPDLLCHCYLASHPSDPHFTQELPHGNELKHWDFSVAMELEDSSFHLQGLFMFAATFHDGWRILIPKDWFSLNMTNWLSRWLVPWFLSIPHT